MKRLLKHPIYSLLLLFFIHACSNSPETSTETAQNEARTADVIVYGGTSAAVTAAVQVAEMGKSVIMVSPDQHLGGLTSGGLGWTDTGNKSVIGGLAHEFYQGLYHHYQQDSSWKWQKKAEYGNTGQGNPAMDGEAGTMWIFEPHAAEQVFEDFIRDHDITVYRNAWLNRDGGVTMEEGRITAIETLDGQRYEGKMFIDATYEGDLMAAAGVSYHVGREANSVYDEEWNGIQVGVLHHGHHFTSDISPYVTPGDASSGLLPLISGDDPGEYGEGDDKIQAYCFRMCLSNHPDNRIAFPKPEGYDPKQYTLLARVFDAGWRETFNKFDPIPNRKTDTNNHGPVSTDNIGMNYDYPEASYQRRREIIQQHEDYQKGLMYFLANDPQVPEEVREEMSQWGLAADEFTDNDNWPHQIYVREARRMIGPVVMTEHEVLGKREVPKPVGMGSYTMDSHNIQRYVKPDGYVQNEGDIGVHPDQPYSISYDALTPKKEECQNLLVPVCVSSSHIAFGSIRMEPVFMILGQSAATAAVQAIDNGTSVQDVDYEQLQAQLTQDGQVLRAGE
ncbi:MAG: FAD-dependent oxidoreductase [Cyclobacteriaceae bacterium]